MCVVLPVVKSIEFRPTNGVVGDKISSADTVAIAVEFTPEMRELNEPLPFEFVRIAYVLDGIIRSFSHVYCFIVCLLICLYVIVVSHRSDSWRYCDRRQRY